jgi:hypothetical protein
VLLDDDLRRPYKAFFQEANRDQQRATGDHPDLGGGPRVALTPGLPMVADTVGLLGLRVGREWPDRRQEI